MEILKDLNAGFKHALDSIYRRNPRATAETILEELSEDHWPHAEYQDVMEYRMANDGYMPGDLNDGYYSSGGPVYHTDYIIRPETADIIHKFYHKEKGLTKSFDEFVQYLEENNALYGHFGNVSRLRLKECAAKYMKVKLVGHNSIANGRRVNRPRYFKDLNTGEYFVQPNRYVAELIPLNPDSIVKIFKGYLIR